MENLLEVDLQARFYHQLRSRTPFDAKFGFPLGESYIDCAILLDGDPMAYVEFKTDHSWRSLRKPIGALMDMYRSHTNLQVFLIYLESHIEDVIQALLNP
jgi:hypothetical protein